MTFTPEQVVGIHVDCPLIGHALRPVTDCFSCPEFAGVADKMPEDKKGREFHQRYIVTCKFPRARPLFKVVSRG